MNRRGRPLAVALLALLLLGSLGANCSGAGRIENYDPATGYVEFSQSGYGLMIACKSEEATSFLWEFFEPDGVTPLAVEFYDVAGDTNPDGVLVDEKFSGTERPHRCWQPVDLYASGAFDWNNPGPPPHGKVRLTLTLGSGGVSVTTRSFRIASMQSQDIAVINSNGYVTFMDEPYVRWFRGEEVVQELLEQRAIDPKRQVWSVGFNLPEQVWAGNNGFFFQDLSDGRNLRAAVAEAFDAVDAYNATAPAGEEIPRGWFGVDFGRVELSRKRNPAQCCIDDGSGNCDPDVSITSPNKDFLGCGGPYEYGAVGPAYWCGVDGVGGVGTSTCHEADGSYGGLEGVMQLDGQPGQPDSLTTERLVYVQQEFVTKQDAKYGIVAPPCEITDFTDYDGAWFCSAYDSMRCLYGPDAGDACTADSECELGFCRAATPLWYGDVQYSQIFPRGQPNRCENPYGYCANNHAVSCEGAADCLGVGGSCVLNQIQGNCERTTNAIGIWDRRDLQTQLALRGMITHTLEEAWNLVPGTNRDHFTVTFGGEGLLYSDRGDPDSCRGDRQGCGDLASSDNTFSHKDDQFSYAGLGDQRIHYRNPVKPGEWEYFDSKFYEGFALDLRRHFSQEAYLIFHGSKYVAPIAWPSIGVTNRFWWMTEPTRARLRDDGRGNRLQVTTLSIPSALNGQAPEPRADALGYAFRSDQLIRLSARHNSMDDGKPVVGAAGERGALWTYWAIDPAEDPAANCPNAVFGGTGASTHRYGPEANCSTQSPDCAPGPDGLCPEESRATCTVDPSDPAWGSCSRLVYSVFDYDNRTSGICSGTAGQPCQADWQCSGTCEARPNVGSDNIQRSVSFVDLDAAALATKGGEVEMDFGGPGCEHSDGVNRATYVDDPAVADCDWANGLLDVGGRAHVEVLDQASPVLDSDRVILSGRFRKIGPTDAGAASGAKIGFGFAAGQGWGAADSIDHTSPLVRSAATREGPQLWFTGTGVAISCPTALSGTVPVTDNVWHDFAITWDRSDARATLSLSGTVRSCTMPPNDGDVGGFVIVPVDSWSTSGVALPFDLGWSDLLVRPYP